MSPRAAVRGLLFAAMVVAVSGCRSAPLSSVNAFVSEPSSAALEDLFDVEWWVRLVEPPMWEYAPRESAAPAVDPDTERVIALTRDGYIRSLSPIDGKVEWSHKTDGHFNAGALVANGVAYVPGGDGILYALNARDGKVQWKYAAGEELASTPVLAGGRVLVASLSDTLFAIDAQTGKWVWQYRRDPPAGFTVHGVGAPRVEGGTAYVGFSDGFLVALDANDGTQKWERALTTSGGTQFLDVDSTPAFDARGRLYAASYKDGVYALEPGSGDVSWHSSRTGLTSVVSGGDVVFSAGDGQVTALQAQDGQSLWSLELGNKAGRAPLLSRGLLLVPTSRSLLFVDPASGRARGAWDPGKGVSATPTDANGRVYVISNLGSVFAVRLRGRGG